MPLRKCLPEVLEIPVVAVVVVVVEVAVVAVAAAVVSGNFVAVAVRLMMYFRCLHLRSSAVRAWSQGSGVVEHFCPNQHNLKMYLLASSPHN